MDLMQLANMRLQCCPACGSANAATIDSRYLEDTGWRRRRRECRACNHRWSTIEIPSELLGDLKQLFHHLQTIERLAGASQRALLDGRLTLAWGEEVGQE